MREGRSIIEEIVARSTGDWVFEDHIYAEVDQYYSIPDDETLFAMSIGIIVEILQTGLMYPVFVEDEPWTQERTIVDSWRGDTWAALKVIEERWRANISNPGFSDVVWFGPTKKGYERGIEVLRREGWRPR